MFLSFLLSFKVVEMDDLLQNPDMLSVARDLTLGPGSGMNTALDSYQRFAQERSVNAKAIFAHYRGKYIGWALLTMESDQLSFHPKDGEACVQIYVHPEFRRKGVGTKMIRLAKIMSKDMVIKVYDHNNIPFFTPFVQEGVCKGIYE